MNKKIKFGILSAVTLAVGITATSVAAVSSANPGTVNPGSTATKAAASGSNQSFITEEQARQIALNKIKGQITSVELEDEHGSTYYDFDIVKNNQKFDVHIDAVTGKPLKVKHDGYVKKSKKQQNKQNAQNTQAAETNAKMITLEKAGEIARSHVKGTIDSIELERKHGKAYYEVELIVGDDDVEVEVDAYTGKILSVDYD